MKYRVLAAVPLIVLASGCPDFGTGPDRPAGTPGTVTFDYTGPVTGTFNATGVRNDEREDPDYGDAVVGGEGALNVYGQSTHADGTVERLWIAFSGREPDEYGITIDCAGAQCAGLEVYFARNEDVGEDYNCQIFEGVVDLQTSNESQAAGTFAGTGLCLGQETLAEFPFTVEDGSFTVPVRFVE